MPYAPKPGHVSIFENEKMGRGNAPDHSASRSAFLRASWVMTWKCRLPHQDAPSLPHRSLARQHL